MKNKGLSLPKTGTDRDKDNEIIVVPTYFSNSTITPANYRGGRILDSYAEIFDKMCIEFITKAENMDSDNGAYMDQGIDSEINKAIKELDKEHSLLRRLILLPLEEMHKGDKVFCEENLKSSEGELKKLKKKLVAYKKICHKGTAFETVMGGESDEE